MIASQKIGKSFMGALRYNMKKLNHPDPALRAEILSGNFASMDTRQIRAEVEALQQLRPNLNRYVYHTSLNFPEEELQALTNEKLKAIAEDYLQAMGYTNNQYLVFRHHDAGHPHLHLLVNRISFDGSVVSDSNNFKRSEAILRRLEYQYNLIPVDQSSFKAVEQGEVVTIKRSNHIAEKAPKKNEIEMAIRTGRPSHKMALQAKLNRIISSPNLSIPELIRLGEQQGIYFLFNQASTGRITGITYFYNEFKVKGQALGNRFKWAELIKKINYEQIRDSKAISAANDKTRSIYGDFTARSSEGKSSDRQGDHGLRSGGSESAQHYSGKSAAIDQDGGKDQPGRETAAGSTKGVYDSDSVKYDHADYINIEISDDEDDAKYRRKSRGSGR